MTSFPAPSRAAATVGPGALTPVAICLLVAALVTRPVGAVGLAVTLGAGVVALTPALPRLEGAAGRGPAGWVIPLVIGLAGFALARLLLAAPAGPVRPWVALGTVGAAVAEEAVFRRLVYGWTLRWGVPAAIAVSAAMFALVHIPWYGTGAFWVDLGAGLVLSWQRWATGSWGVPAATHAAANLLQLL